MSQLKEDITPSFSTNSDEAHFTLSADRDSWRRVAERLEREKNAARQVCDSLGSAIAQAARKAGIYNGDAPLDVPQLVMLCDDLAQENERLKAHLADVQHDFAASEKHCQDHHAEVG